jgi:type VI secretion system secreted protein VgrG
MLLADKGSPEALEEAVMSLYLLVGVQHSCRLPAGYTSTDNKGFYYRNQFTVVPIDTPYRPARMPKPVIAGTQTAVVVGPKDGEVFTDKYGRVKVQFFWDREHQKNLDSSCWIRVAQMWAGKRWGTHFWPRVGQEVVVAFEEGDPDQPIIVGSVFNQKNMPPYLLSENLMTRSGIKTHSTPEDKDNPLDHFNEIRFEDKKGAEELFVQAERNLDVVVKADENRATGGDFRREVYGKGGMTTLVENGRYVVGARERMFFVSGKSAVDIVSQEQFVRLSVGPEAAQNTDPKNGIHVTKEQVALYVGENELIIDKDGISMKCGGGSIALDSGGNVLINGTSVKINDASAPKVAASAACSGGVSGMLEFMKGLCKPNGQATSPANGSGSNSDLVGAGAGSYSS